MEYFWQVEVFPGTLDMMPLHLRQRSKYKNAHWQLFFYKYVSCRNLTVKESVFVMTDNPPTDRPFGSPWRSIMKINNWKIVPQLQKNEIRWIFQETIIYYSNLSFVFWRHRKCLENLFNCMYLIGSKHNWFDQFRGCISGYVHVLIGCTSLMGCPVLTYE